MRTGTKENADDRWWELGITAVRNVNVYMSLKLEESNCIQKPACPMHAHPVLTAFAPPCPCGRMWKELSECSLNLRNELTTSVGSFPLKYFPIGAFTFMCVPLPHITVLCFPTGFNSWSSRSEQYSVEICTVLGLYFLLTWLPQGSFLGISCC